MFGYVLLNTKALTDDQSKRFRAIYCGMCDSLRERYGQFSRFTLSYDMTFLALTLSALYECPEQEKTGRCAPHMVKPHKFIRNEMIDYAVDMNILLAYWKCRDNVTDDRNILSLMESKLLEKAYHKAASEWPEQAEAIEKWISDNAVIEQSSEMNIDAGMNITGKMLGELFRFRGDLFPEELYAMGENLGRFIYFMDAYEDLEKDIRRKRYNALRAFSDQSDYEDFCRASLSMIIADCADAFERMPIVKDADLIRNILYGGVWAKYGSIQKKKAKSKGLKEHKNAGSI